MSPIIHSFSMGRAWLEIFSVWGANYRKFLDSKASHHDAETKRLLIKHMRAIAKYGKKVIAREVKARYTYKGAIARYIKSTIGAQTSRLVVRSTRLDIKKFKFKAPSKKRYMTATVLKGSTSTIKKGFQWRSLMMKRVGQPRLPIKKVMGPSVAEMAGHEPQPATNIMRAIESKNAELLDQMLVEYAKALGFL